MNLQPKTLLSSSTITTTIATSLETRSLQRQSSCASRLVLAPQHQPPCSAQQSRKVQHQQFTPENTPKIPSKSTHHHQQSNTAIMRDDDNQYLHDGDDKGTSRRLRGNGVEEARQRLAASAGYVDPVETPRVPSTPRLQRNPPWEGMLTV
jgi:hypothetical protein